MESFFFMLAKQFYFYLFLFWFSFWTLAYSLFLFVTLSLSSPTPLFPPLSQSGEDESSGLSQERSQTQEARPAGNDPHLSFSQAFCYTFLH